MAKNDYEVIVCKILISFYRRMKGKITREELKEYLIPFTKDFPIEQDYFNSVILDLIDLGYLADINVTRAWGGDIVSISLTNGRITLKGVEYLRSNSMMNKIAKTLKEAKDIWSLFI